MNCEVDIGFNDLLYLRDGIDMKFSSFSLQRMTWRALIEFRFWNPSINEHHVSEKELLGDNGHHCEPCNQEAVSGAMFLKWCCYFKFAKKKTK